MSGETKPLALIVIPELATLSSFQNELGRMGYLTVVSRDLPTALLATVQNDFDLAILASRISEEGDGYALGGVLRRIFPDIYLAVLAPQRSVAGLQAAINHGISQVYDASASATEILGAVLHGQEKNPGRSVH